MVDWDLYKDYVDVLGETRRDRIVNSAIRAVELAASAQPAYQECIVDGEHKVDILVIGSDDLSTKKFNVMPSDAEYMHYGAVVEWDNGYWIVTDLDFDSTVTKNGYMKFCNMKLRFQIGEDPTIYERHGVFDPGVYSTTEKDGEVLTQLNWQYKVFLPYDDATSKLYVDKRFAIGTMPDMNGNDILECYRFTKRDITSQSIGNDRVLIMYCKSDVYNPVVDNIEEMICDYVEPSGGSVDEPTDDEFYVEINNGGKTTVRIGGYGSVFDAIAKDKNGDVIDSVVFTWSISNVDGIHLQVIDSYSCRVYADNYVISGTPVILTLHGVMEEVNKDASIVLEAITE